MTQRMSTPTADSRLLREARPHLAGFLDYLQAECGLSLNTRKAYRRDLRDCLVHLSQAGVKDLARLSPRHIEQFLRKKKPASIDSPEVQAIKSLIRKIEARVSAGFCGVPKEHCHFLEMPFYNTGTVQKLSIGERDVQIVVDLLLELKPDIIFAAGDLSDPHGTHRMCLEAVFRAAEQLRNKPWFRDCEIWLYRGAWQEWGPEQIDMAVPLSPDELQRKRHAIFRHESQKDRAMFPGPHDTREFWQRAQDRNRETARLYDRLGLAEYEAIEAFMRWQPQR